MSEVEEINTVKEIKGDNVYEDNYRMDVKSTIRLQSRPRRLNSIHKLKRNTNQ